MLRILLVCLTLFCSLLPVSAQGRPRRRIDDYKNQLAPYVNSPVPTVEKMLEMANPQKGETLYDLGCGDGRILMEAAQRYGIRAVGVELSPTTARRAQEEVLRRSLQDLVTIITGDLMETDLRPADIVTMYLMTDANERVRPRLEQYLRPGTRVVSHDFVIPGWKPTRIERSDPNSRKHAIYLYVMPPQRQ